MRIDNISNDQTQTQAITKEINHPAPNINEEIERAIKNGDLESMVNEMNDLIVPSRTNVKFQLHEKLNNYYVEVVNATTQEVIREIPPKKMLDMYAEMADLMGLIIDRKI